ncbi:hypothetical protein YC2023_011622 [Brassica napus]
MNIYTRVSPTMLTYTYSHIDDSIATHHYLRFLHSQRLTKTNAKNTRVAENQDTSRHLITKKLEGVKEKTSSVTESEDQREAFNEF